MGCQVHLCCCSCQVHLCCCSSGCCCSSQVHICCCSCGYSSGCCSCVLLLPCGLCCSPHRLCKQCGVCCPLCLGHRHYRQHTRLHWATQEEQHYNTTTLEHCINTTFANTSQSLQDCNTKHYKL